MANFLPMATNCLVWSFPMPSLPNSRYTSKLCCLIVSMGICAACVSCPSWRPMHIILPWIICWLSDNCPWEVGSVAKLVWMPCKTPWANGPSLWLIRMPWNIKKKTLDCIWFMAWVINIHSCSLSLVHAVGMERAMFDLVPQQWKKKACERGEQRERYSFPLLLPLSGSFSLSLFCILLSLLSWPWRRAWHSSQLCYMDSNCIHCHEFITFLMTLLFSHH